MTRVCTRSCAWFVSLAASSKGVECVAMCALCFANGMIFTEDILDRDGVAQHHNSRPIVHTKITYGNCFATSRMAQWLWQQWVRMSLCQPKLKQSLQWKSGFHLVMGKKMNFFPAHQIASQLGLHPTSAVLPMFQWLLHSLFFCMQKERAGHGKFGKRTQRQHIHSCLVSPVNLMCWMNTSEVTRTLLRTSVRQDNPNYES